VIFLNDRKILVEEWDESAIGQEHKVNLLTEEETNLYPKNK